MTAKTAAEVIALIRADSPDATADQIRAALEDGEALTALGITDDDQQAVEEAHASIKEDEMKSIKRSRPRPTIPAKIEEVETKEDFAAITPASGWGISFPAEYINKNTGNVIAFGKPMANGKYACSTRVKQNYIDMKTMVFGFVQHPAHGLIAVSKQEFEALGLPEVVVRA